MVSFNVECDGLKNSFPIVVSEDEGADSSDDEDDSIDLDLNEQSDWSALLPPPTAVDFPVAPSSPEIRENDCAFSFIERVSLAISWLSEITRVFQRKI